jgi:hypothetical protein
MALKDLQSPFPKQNCWEFLKCGREPGGKNIDHLGICPASTDTSSDGLNEGINGGRMCWAISGTYCHKKMQGLFAKTQLSCRSCIFFKNVKEEEEGIEQYHQDIGSHSL